MSLSWVSSLPTPDSKATNKTDGNQCLNIENRFQQLQPIPVFGVGIFLICYFCKISLMSMSINFEVLNGGIGGSSLRGCDVFVRVLLSVRLFQHVSMF